MKIVYYTSGVTGSGRLVTGLSIRNAFLRKNIPVEFTILHSSTQAHILQGVENVVLPMETISQTGPAAYDRSAVYRQLIELAPDVLVVDLLWVPLRSFLGKLPCRKIFLCRQTSNEFFRLNDRAETIVFDPSCYDMILATEPWPCPVTDKQINPIVIRNPDEILPRDKALRDLGLEPDKKNCLLSLNTGEHGETGTGDLLSSLESSGWKIFKTSLLRPATSLAGTSPPGIFPITDYYNAFDKIISGAGYNAFWEAVYFKKEAVFLPQRRVFETQQWRMDNCRNFTFTENGADQLVRIVMGL
ncbi:MAG: hypothetical protein EHM28_01110 [Spirochaetaceae bacterium]|nr:MAG: hypothetical protein EHM28_01110 [Spirochaetaceae bacterium]